jgi:hypothetical protein
VANNGAQRRKKAAINIECDPSLKDGLEEAWRAAGFKTLSDFVITLVRDFRAGKFPYKAGYLQMQAKSSPN